MRYPDTSKVDKPPVLEPDNYIIKLDEIREENKDGLLYKDKNGRTYILLFWKVKGHDTQTLLDMVYPDADSDCTEDYGRLLRIREIVSALNAPVEGGDFFDLVGKTCRAAVIIEPYKGEDRNRIAHYETLESAGDSFTGNKEDDDLPF